MALASQVLVGGEFQGGVPGWLSLVLLAAKKYVKNGLYGCNCGLKVIILHTFGVQVGRGPATNPVAVRRQVQVCRHAPSTSFLQTPF